MHTRPPFLVRRLACPPRSGECGPRPPRPRWARGSNTRLEAAATRAVALGAMRYKNLASMLKTGLDRAPLPASAPQQAELALPDAHANLRGAHYYH